MTRLPPPPPHTHTHTHTDKQIVNKPIVNLTELLYAQTDIIGCTMMIKAELFSRMIEESKWFINNNSFFDSVWAYWFALNSKIYCLPENMSSYRISVESGCHTNDEEKKLAFQKRYYLNKAYYVINSPLAIEEKMNILSSEYDYLYNNACYDGEKKVRSSFAYRIGKSISNLLKMMRMHK